MSASPLQTPETASADSQKASTQTHLMAEIMIWSATGHTPITHRVGPYCDVLLETTREAANPNEAHEIVKELMRNTPGAHKAHYYLPAYWNQNTRTGWVNISQLD